MRYSSERCNLLISLRWRHNDHASVSNHQPHGCLLNRLFRRKSKKHQSSASLAFVREIHRGPVNFPHKWPVTRKMFPSDDVIMLGDAHQTQLILCWGGGGGGGGVQTATLKLIASHSFVVILFVWKTSLTYSNVWFCMTTKQFITIYYRTVIELLLQYITLRKLWIMGWFKI